MAQLNHSKRRYVRRPGLKAAAAGLGVDYSHLRRVVAGQFQNDNLLSLYHQVFAKSQNPQPKK